MLIDGKNVKDYSFRGLYDKMGYVTQKAVLFSDTIEGNVAFGEAAQAITEEDVKKAIDISQAQEFIDKMEEGLYSHIAQSGGNVSGGQKQRVAIARAIVNNPEILLADEPTGALDSTSGEQVMELFQKLNDEGVSVLMITHDPEIAAHAKRVVMIRDGELQEKR